MIHRKINELVARYTLEPGIRDIYVEGRFDKDVIQWYVQRLGYRDVRVFEIGLVDVAGEILQKYGLRPGEKSRTIALAEELANQLGNDMRQATAVVGSDCDRFCR